MHENTTKAIIDIINTVNGYVIVPLERLETLEDAESKAAVARRVLAEERMGAYDIVDVLRAVFNAYPPQPKKEDDE